MHQQKGMKIKRLASKVRTSRTNQTNHQECEEGSAVLHALGESLEETICRDEEEAYNSQERHEENIEGRSALHNKRRYDARDEGNDSTGEQLLTRTLDGSWGAPYHCAFLGDQVASGERCCDAGMGLQDEGEQRVHESQCGPAQAAMSA